MSALRIATRNSPLALWQANFVKQELEAEHPDLVVEVVGMTTRGDQLLDRSLANEGGKGLFLKELQVSLLNGDTDIAVHSMKDVPAEIPEGLQIHVLCKRADPRDAFVSNEYQNLYALPEGARVGTASLRRVSQLRAAFPSLEFVDLRGNVNTRLAKLDAGDYDAIILAAAGLIRLGLIDRIKQFIAPELCLPAVGQGIVGIECRSGDSETLDLLMPLHDRESELVLTAERSMNAVLEGGCSAPIAGFAEFVKGRVRLRAMVASPDGSRVLSSDLSSENMSAENANLLGRQTAVSLLKQGANALLKGRSEPDAMPADGQRPVVLLTRQSRFLGNMESLLDRMEYHVEKIETMRVDPQMNEGLLNQFSHLGMYTDIIFVSRNAVEYGMSILNGLNSEIPVTCRVMAVGAETAKQLYNHGIDALFPEHGTGADALLTVRKMHDLNGRRILIVRGTHGLTGPSDEMRKRGAEVDHADVYTQNMPRESQEQVRRLLKQHKEIAGVYIHSGQSAQNFMTMVRNKLQRLEGCVMVVGGERIADVARKLGWKYAIKVAESPSNKHMMIAFSQTRNHKAE